MKEIVKLIEVKTTFTTASNSTMNEVKQLIDTYRKYGIEAARALLLGTFVITFDLAKLDINPLHLEVIAEHKTLLGDVRGFTCYDTAKGSTSNLSTIAFEQPKRFFQRAVMFPMEEEVKDCSTTELMFGKF